MTNINEPPERTTTPTQKTGLEVAAKQGTSNSVYSKATTKKRNVVVLLLGLAALLIIWAFFSCAKPPLSAISLKDSSLTLGRGENYKLEYTLIPDNTRHVTLVWKSSAESVVEVNYEGLITAVNYGKAIIYVSNGNGIESSCAVTVPVVLPTSISFADHMPSVMYINEPLSLDLFKEVIVEPKDAVYENLTWISSNDSIATVCNGVITGLKKGTVYITVATENGFEATKEFKVFLVPPESVSLKKTEIELFVGQTYRLKPILKPGNAETEFVFTGPDVDKTGLVTANEIGTSEITVTTSNGKTVKCKVNVKKQSPITIKNLRYTIDSAGGVEWTFKIKNNTSKEIKYVILKWNCYNGVGDLIRDHITGQTYKKIRYTGPLGVNKTTTLLKNTTKFYNCTFKELKFTDITVEYMDGTTEEITNDYVGWIN